MSTIGERNHHPDRSTSDGAAGWSFFGAAMPSDAMSAALARNWWAISLRGVVAVIFGLIALLLPGVTLASLVLLFGAYMVVDGVLAVVAAVRAARQGERWGLLIFEGIADLAAAADAFKSTVTIQVKKPKGILSDGRVQVGEIDRVQRRGAVSSN